MRKIFKKIGKSLLVGVLAVFLVTVGIDAADKQGNLRETIVGKIIFGEESICPDGMNYVLNAKGNFCIDTFELSASKDCPYSNPANQNETKLNLDTKDCVPASLINSVPWRFISQTQAEIACAKAGKRLPTPEEWYRASLGTPDKFPGGKDDCQIDNNWESQPGSTGSGINCVSSAGAYDMVGNVWEWVNGEIAEGEYDEKKMPEQGYVKEVNIGGMAIATSKKDGDKNFNNDYLWIKDNGIRGIARGGYWGNKEQGGIFSMYLVSRPSFVGEGIGFRCVK